MSKFKELYELNVNKQTEKKNGLTYLSWAYAWAEFKKVHPTAEYKITMIDGKPYTFDENIGYMVFTEVSADDVTHGMWLPVMDGANNAMKHERYAYKVKEWKNGKLTGEYIDKWVEPCSMFDINKAIMRCLTKNLAMHGLGLYIYAGEDLPEVVETPEDVLDRMIVSLNKQKTVDGVDNFVSNSHVVSELEKQDKKFNADFNRCVEQRKNEITSNVS